MLVNLCALEIAESGLETQKRPAALVPCWAYCGDVHSYAAGTIPPHWHPQPEIFAVDSGSISILLSSGSVTLHAQQGCFINTGVLHGMRAESSEPCLYHSITFDGEIFAGSAGSVYDIRYLRPLQQQGPAVLPFSQNGPHAALAEYFEAAYNACKDEPNGYEIFLRNALSSFLFTAAQCIDAKPAMPPAAQREARMKQLLTWVDTHYAEPRTAAAMAAAVHISVRECERCFAEVLHTSPTAYLLRRRVAAASELLAGTQLSVLDIALRCGFSSAGYFSAQFRSVAGLSPRDFRAKIHAE